MGDNIMNLQLHVYEDEADAERIEEITLSLMKQIKDFNVEFVERKKDGSIQGGAKGDPITIGALVLGIATVAIPPLMTFLQKWVGEHRKIVLEAPNGAKAEFVAKQQYSKEEILDLMNKLNKMPAGKK